ncbi:HEAT repeat domain-containing protein [Nitrospira sp. Nam80]
MHTIPTASWLTFVLVIEATALAGSLGLLFGQAAWLRWVTRWLEPKRQAARSIVLQALEAGTDQSQALEAVTALPLHAQVELITDLGENLNGVKLKALANIAKQSGILDHSERLCRSRWWSRRVRGIRLFTVLAEGEHIIPSLFPDPSAIVRSELANWAAAHPSPEMIDILLRLLDDADGFCRFAAHNALYRMGLIVVEPLARHLESQTGVALERAMAVAVSLGHERFIDPARACLSHADPTIRTLAIEALGKSGSLRFAPALLDRLNDPAAHVRQAAAHALGRLKCWQASPAVARLLEDPVWTVRQEAALTLRSLGAPGILLLRRSNSSRDKFARDMAQHVLGFPRTKVNGEAA